MILFLSDLHLDYCSDYEKKSLKEFFSKNLKNYEKVILNGDIFDSPAREKSVLEDVFEIYSLFKEFLESGGEVIYLVGNHDIGMTAFLGNLKSVKAVISYPSVLLEVDGFHIHAEHGHLYDPLFKTSLYDFMKIFEDRFHVKIGDIAEKLMEEIASKFQTMQKENFGVPKTLLNIWEKEAEELIENNGYDIVVFGHTHFAEIKEFGGRIYLNTGSWIENMTYGEYKEGFASLFSYKQGFSELIKQVKLEPRQEDKS